MPTVSADDEYATSAAGQWNFGPSMYDSARFLDAAVERGSYAGGAGSVDPPDDPDGGMVYPMGFDPEPAPPAGDWLDPFVALDEGHHWVRGYLAPCRSCNHVGGA